ncbi:hypothetical protein D3C87_1787360 [compost metagenome]
MEISSLRIWSRISKKGLGRGGGSSPPGSTEMLRSSWSRAMRTISEISRSAGKVAIRSTIAATSPVTAAERRCVTSCQCRSMKTKATTDCNSTIGMMTMSSERA